MKSFRSLPDQNWRRERLERFSTEDLIAGLNGQPTSEGKVLVVNGGGKTLVRQILRDRGVTLDEAGRETEGVAKAQSSRPRYRS